ncbi:hypothetical protein [uncultured Proteiniphilum sp.]|uniref:TlpA family protein disulfide reductase n=1 Tax=uncultured Proteiniphilum sp. TaxID=497637 RepID=UPI002626D7CE|nr:hypothetical protein [uncultured Proteiniphilum sp.]
MKLEFIFLLFICPVFLFSQEMIKNADGSVSIIADTMIYLDSSGNHLDKNLHQDSLSTGKYDVSLKKIPGGIEIQLKKRYSEERYPELQLDKEFPPLELVDINQNKINIGKKTGLTLLTFWDITCKPCIEELIVFNILANEYPEVNFMALTSTPLQDVNNFFQERGFEWKNLIIVPDCQEYFDILKIHILPLNVIIDNNRIIKRVFVGKNIREVLLSFEDLKEKTANII